MFESNPCHNALQYVHVGIHIFKQLYTYCKSQRRIAFNDLMVALDYKASLFLSPFSKIETLVKSVKKIR